MSIVVVRPGLLTTLQDLGRPGHQHLGVPVNGAMDQISHRLANMLVGNDESEATLELTLNGPTLEFRTDAVIALCGAAMPSDGGGEEVPWWRPVRVPAGTTITIGRPEIGCRAYLAVAGGFDVPAVLGSRATALTGGYGGFRGRALKKGDVLALRSPQEAQTVRWVRLLVRHHRGLAYPNWSVSRARMPYRVQPQTVRVVPGRHWQTFPVAAREQLTRALYRVALDSNRMGYRLEGAPLEARRGSDVLSEAVVMGAVQIPSGGDPIVLMADRQTTGGYPVIAVVAGIDLPVMAQIAPGEDVQFRMTTIEESYEAAAEREHQLGRVKQALDARLQH
ncbi:MAG: 5-oxoprolinase/urea amidolyase family protein [Betaproteobacteria bacterium]|nr:5-oxoprolinase/urea amidolyase family protein [Betaproteobacteria bacterium]